MARRKNKQQQKRKPEVKKDPVPESDEEEKEEAPVVPAVKKTIGKNNNKKQNKKQAKPSSDEESSDEEGAKEDSESEKEDSDDESESGVEKGAKPFFSDENAKWLKPKTKASLLDSDDEDNDDEGDDKDASDGSDDEDDDMLDIEREAQDEDEERLLEEDEADTEMRRTISQHTAIYHLPTVEELAVDADRVVPPSEIRGHIESILEVLADFKTRREPGRARTEYIELLGGFIAEQYGYLPELIEYFLTMFGAAECLEFVDASDKPRPLVVRTNTLKTRRKDLAAALMKRGVSLDPLAAWSKVGLKIVESPVPVGATPEYLSGQYMLQSAASMCPVLALAPEPKQRVMDMAAAPGGKTSYISQLMRNTGSILANDLKADRQKATVANMHRLGVKNVITCTHDGRKLGVLFKNRFDRILLDAPCSGLGVISRDPSVKVQRTMADVKKCAHLQKELILAAIDALRCNKKSGGSGIMVYSTCSIAIAENEEVVQYALEKRNIKILDAGLDFGKPGFVRYQHKRFHPSMALTRRFYPHVHNMDGFFVCKIQKLGNGPPPSSAGTVPDVEETVAEDEKEEEKEPATTVDYKKEQSKKDKKSLVLPDKKSVVLSDKKPFDKKASTSPSPSNNRKSPGKKRPRKDDRRSQSGQQAQDESSPQKKRKQDMSVPPIKKNTNKPKKTNAKVTKPRRNKVASEF